MSFSKTISVFAALCSVFGAAAAGYKLSQDSQVKPVEDVNQKYEERITELQQQVSTLQQQATNTNPPTVVALPQPTIVKQVAPVTPQLPPPPQPPVPPKPFE